MRAEWTMPYYYIKFLAADEEEKISGPLIADSLKDNSKDSQGAGSTGVYFVTICTHSSLWDEEIS